MQSFSEEYGALSNSEEIDENSPLCKLNPMLHKNLLRVQGRFGYLYEDDMPFEERHPMILGRNSHMTHLIILPTHRTFCHIGPETTLRLLTARYWICGQRTTIRKALKHCPNL